MHTRPLVIAHRGASGYRPEHTLASYELAIAMGADYIEPDLCITRDGVLIARHENEISDATDVAGRLEFRDRRTRKTVDGRELDGWFAEDFTFAEIKTLRARERFPFRDRSFDGRFEIPAFEEVLALARRHGVGVYPETKHPSYFRQLGLPLEERLVEALHGAGFRGRGAAAFLQSFETGNLRHLRTLTDLPLIQLLDTEGRPWGDSRSYQDLATPAGLAEIATYADGIGPNKRMIVPAGPDGRLLPPATLVEDAHRAGLAVHPWTMRSDPRFLAPDYEGDPGREYRQLLDLGVDGLFSDFPDLARRAVDLLERRPS
jgi:glycerophosphoryl diester phosphodiesterase